MRSMAVPLAITWASLVKILTIKPAPKNMQTAPTRMIAELISQAARIPFFTRLYWRAPIFWPTNVVMAMLKLCSGS